MPCPVLTQRIATVSAYALAVPFGTDLGYGATSWPFDQYAIELVRVLSTLAGTERGLWCYS
eukprot:3796133-Rhodomonas_salina.3